MDEGRWTKDENGKEAEQSYEQDAVHMVYDGGIHTAVLSAAVYK
jgi:hypothetical protein